MNTTPKILVVDDEPDLELLINQKFRKEIKQGKYSFEFAGNGIEAFNKLTANNDIELVLTDINMPEMDGLTLLSKIKELNNPLLHSVIVSAYGDIINIRTAMNGGAFDFVVKPIDFNDLEITINKALDNLASFKKALRVRDELITVRKELDEARTLQLSMLPSTIPEVDELNISAFMKTASEVGGDYYDFSNKNDGSLNIAVGDATGHGMKAGIMVSIMKTLFITNSSHHDLEEFFKLANEAIKSLNLGRMMVAFAMVNINVRKLQVLNAGMPPIYLYRDSEKKVFEIGGHNLPLGAVHNSSYSSEQIELNDGDAVLMLSDGFPEIQNANNQQYGYNRLIDIFLEIGSKNTDEIIKKLKNEVSNWVGNNEIEDDVTFVVIKIK